MKYRITVQLPGQERTPTEELLERAVLLLEAVAEYGAIYPAAKKLGINYSHAWSSIRKVELSLGEDLLVRVGGSSGCKLTARALELTKEYRRVQAAAQAAADRVTAR